MPAVRDYFGSPCPSCKRDILQAAPSSNRMPGEARAWCPSCQSRFSYDDLAHPRPRGGGLFRRLFGGGAPESH